MRRAQQFATRIANWEIFIANLRPFLPELPFLQPILTQMEAVLTEARDLDNEQEVARSRFQEIVHRRQDLEKLGENLRSRAAAHLKGTYGFTNDALVRFGIRPRKTGPRGPRQQPAPTPAPAPQE